MWPFKFIKEEVKDFPLENPNISEEQLYEKVGKFDQLAVNKAPAGFLYGHYLSNPNRFHAAWDPQKTNADIIEAWLQKNNLL